MQLEVGDEAHKSSVWIDRNQNEEYDEGEEVTSFNKSIRFDHSTPVITIYGQIENLFCYANSLTDINLSEAPSLILLDAGNNKLTSLDISSLRDLRFLTVSRNNLTTLKVSDAPFLYRLYCQYNELTELDLAENPDIAQFACDHNKLTSLDVTMLESLSYFSCVGNQLSELDLSRNSDLTQFYCYENNLTSLDLSNCESITRIAANQNKLTEIIGLGNCPSLVYLSLFDNQIDEKNMLRIATDLPQCSAEEGGEFYGIDTSLSPQDGNVLSKTSVASLKSKNGLVYDYQGGYNQGKNPYDGSDDTAVNSPIVSSLFFNPVTLEVFSERVWKTATLYKSKGEQVAYSENAYSLDLSEVSEGVFFARVTYPDGNQQYLKFFK